MAGFISANKLSTAQMRDTGYFRTPFSSPASVRPLTFRPAAEAVAAQEKRYADWTNEGAEKIGTWKNRPFFMNDGLFHPVYKGLTREHALTAKQPYLSFLASLELISQATLILELCRDQKRADTGPLESTIAELNAAKDGIKAGLLKDPGRFDFPGMPVINTFFSFGNHTGHRDIDNYSRIMEECKADVILHEDAIGFWATMFLNRTGIFGQSMNQGFQREYERRIYSTGIPIFELEQRSPLQHIEHAGLERMMDTGAGLTGQQMEAGDFLRSQQAREAHLEAFGKLCIERNRAFAVNFRDFMETLPLFCPELSGKEEINVLVRYGGMHRDLLPITAKMSPEINYHEYVDTSILPIIALGADREFPDPGRLSEQELLNSLYVAFANMADDPAEALMKTAVLRENYGSERLAGICGRGNFVARLERELSADIASKGLNSGNAAAFLREKLGSVPEISLWLDICDAKTPAPSAPVSSAPEKIAAFRNRMAAFDVSTTTKYADRVINFKYNQEGLSSEEVASVLISLGFELSNGSWARTRESV